MSVVAEFDHAYDEATERVASLMGVINAANGALVTTLGEALDDRFCEGWGIHSPGHWAAWQTGMSPAHAHGVMKVAGRRHELPCAVAALVAGELTLDAVIEIANRAPANHEESITEFAKGATIAQLRKTLRNYAYDEDGEAERPQPREGTRGVSTGSDDQGWWLRARLDADEGAVVDQALKAILEDLRRQARAETLEGEEPQRVTLADATIALAEAGLRAGEAAFPGSGRYLVHLHLDGRPGPTGGPGDGTTSRLSFHLGGPVPEGLRALLLCDGSVRSSIWDGTTPLNVGRKTRIISRRLRRLVEHRDQGCRVPGCGRTSGLEIHHIIHWEHHGSTDTANLITLCRMHHRTHHMGLLAIAGNADLDPAPGAVQARLVLAPGSCGDTQQTRDAGLLSQAQHPVTFTDKFGHQLDPSGHPVLPDDGCVPADAARSLDVAPTVAYIHPYGEPLQSGGVFFAKDPGPPPEPPTPRDSEPGSDDQGGDPKAPAGPGSGPHDRAVGSELPADPRHGGPPTSTSPPQD